MDGRIRCTAVNGLEAVWTMRKYGHIEIGRARDTATGEAITFPPGTDLADARERTSRRWTAVWDRIAHQMWTEWIPGRSGQQPVSRQQWSG